MIKTAMNGISLILILFNRKQTSSNWIVSRRVKTQKRDLNLRW